MGDIENGNGKQAMLLWNVIRLGSVIGGLVISLILIGRWWGATQQELSSIDDTMKRIDSSLNETAKATREIERTTLDHEYRIRNLEKHTGGPHGGPD